MAADAPHPGFEPYVDEAVPQAAPGAPGKDGRLELAFERVGGETRLVRDFARAPFHVSGTLDTDPLAEAATVSVQSPTGGIAQGDRRTVEVSVGPDAVARVGTGSATKVYSMRHNYARVETSLSVDDGGHLEYLPEPTIIHADARLYRSTALKVVPSATAVVGDVLVPGRLARGERLAFERFVDETLIRGGDRLLAADALHLEPDARDPRVPGVLGDGVVLGTLFVIAPAAETAALSDALHEAVADTDGVAAGATALPNDAGVLVRILGEAAEPVRVARRDGWRAARAELLDASIPGRV